MVSETKSHAGRPGRKCASRSWILPPRIPTNFLLVPWPCLACVRRVSFSSSFRILQKNRPNHRPRRPGRSIFLNYHLLSELLDVIFFILVPRPHPWAPVRERSLARARLTDQLGRKPCAFKRTGAPP